MFATEQCLLVLTHHPAVWHQAAQFLDQSSKILAEKGVRICSIKLLIHLFNKEKQFKNYKKRKKSSIYKKLTFQSF